MSRLAKANIVLKVIIVDSELVFDIFPEAPDKNKAVEISSFNCQANTYSVLQIRRCYRDNFNNLGIIFYISPLKRMLRPIIRTVSLRRF